MGFVRPGQGQTTMKRPQQNTLNTEVKSDAAIAPIRNKSVTYKANGEEMTLTFDDVKQYFCRDASDADCMIFLLTCSRNGFDPFLREAQLIKYDQDEPARIVIGKDAYLKRAEAHPEFDGFEAGLTVYNADTGEMDRRQGSAYWPDFGETLLGGWARVYRKGRRYPYYDEVSLSEYQGKKKSGETTSMWKQKAATMVRKVALVHAMREAFSSSFSGTYDESEIVAEGTARDVDDDFSAQSRIKRTPKKTAQAVELIKEDDSQADAPCEGCRSDADPRTCPVRDCGQQDKQQGRWKDDKGGRPIRKRTKQPRCHSTNQHKEQRDDQGA